MTRSILTALLRVLLRVFFRRLSVTGHEHVPATGPVVFILNHPNALVDPVVLLCHAGRPVSFLAKEPLFRLPVLGFFVRALDSIPVWRQMDRADTSKNRETFLAARRLLAHGGSLALFPEGTSHSDPRLKPFRTGAARIALGAAGAEGLRLVPAGLFYTDKTRFRSAALLCFGPPIDVAPVPGDATGEPPPEAVRALTTRLQVALGALTQQADHHEALRLAAAAEQILVPDRTDLATRLRLRQRLLDGYARLRETEPDRLATLESRVARYDHALRAADLTPELVPASAWRPRVVLRVTARALVVLLLLLPMAVIGMVLHAPAWFLIDLIARRFARRSQDVVATVKALGGLLFYPVTWLALGAGISLRWTWPAGLAAALLAPWLGWAALRFLERFDRLAGGARGLLLVLTGRRRWLRLVAERNRLREDLIAVGREYGLVAD